MGCKTSTLIYSDTGEGKTSLAGSWARWVFRETGLPVACYTREPGGLDSIMDLIEDGIVKVWDLGDRKYPSETLEFASNGYWFDGSKLIPTAEWLPQIGGAFFEGGTSFGEFLMEELREKAGKGEIAGAEKAPQQYTSGELKIAGSNQTMYGMTQSRIRRAMEATQRLPIHVLWTCRETKADDPEMVSGYKEIYGPQIVGQALTPHVPSWFGRTIHIDVAKAAGDKTVHKAFYKTHFAEGGRIPYIANPRLPVQIVDQLPDAEIIAKDGLHFVRLFDKIRELKQKARGV